MTLAQSHDGFSTPMTARIALLLSLFACLTTVSLAHADGDPAGQFLPALGDRDGDGLPDAADCAADDPTRPGRSGVDLDCDGAPDGGGSGIDIGILGPVDGGPDPSGEPGRQTAASRPSSGTGETRTAARRAAGEGVVAVKGLRLGPSVAVYTPAATAPALVFVAKDNSGITVRPSVVVDGERRALKVRTRSVPRGRAWVVRVHQGRRVRFTVTVVDSGGVDYTAARALPAR
ncbi:MAG: hypothetical protein ACJ762_01490 [Solirubrobacteraceae bacterium]